MPELKGHSEWHKHYRAALMMAQDGGTVALLGSRGTGKTQAAVEVIRYFCSQSTPERPLSSIYTTAAELFQKIRLAFGPDRRITEDRAIAKFVSPRLLVIDEVQVRRNSDFEEQSLTLILDKRYGARRPTILIANLEPKAFFESVGESIEDRMDEGGGHFVFAWESFRKKAK